MMRYQRVSPDIFPLKNGSKLSLRTFKENNPDHSGRIQNFSNFDAAKSLRGRPGSRSASRSPSQDHNFPHVAFPSDSPAAFSENLPPPSSSATPSASPSPTRTNNNHREINGIGRADGGCEVLLQWGHNKRSRRSRTERSTLAAPTVVGGVGRPESSPHPRQPVKIQRRSAIAAAQKVAAVAAVSAMSPPCGSFFMRGANLRPCTPLRDAAGPPIHSSSRTLEDRSNGLTRSEKRSPPSPLLDKSQRISANGIFNGGRAVDGSTHPDSKQQQQQQQQPSDQETGGGTATVSEKLNLDRFEWPKIYLSLSRKEKEDDFFAMKGTKLPQRPKKRAKNVDKTLQFCFPGMWLSDLTRSRYEVREKKCVKKKRRGLKGMESMDSDSD